MPESVCNIIVHALVDDSRQYAFNF